MTNKRFKNAFFLCLIFALSALPTFAVDEEVDENIDSALQEFERGILEKLDTIERAFRQINEAQARELERQLPPHPPSLRQRFTQPNAASSYSNRTQEIEEVDADSCGDLLCCCFCILSPFVIQLGAFLAANAPS